MKLKPIKKYAIHRWAIRIYHKLKIVYSILFKRNHMVIIYFTLDDLEGLILDDRLYSDEITLQFAGCMQHQGLRVIKEAAASIDDTDIICDKAMFEVEAVELLNSLKKDNK